MHDTALHTGRVTPASEKETERKHMLEENRVKHQTQLRQDRKASRVSDSHRWQFGADTGPHCNDVPTVRQHCTCYKDHKGTGRLRSAQGMTEHACWSKAAESPPKEEKHATHTMRTSTKSKQTPLPTTAHMRTLAKGTLRPARTTNDVGIRCT